MDDTPPDRPRYGDRQYWEKRYETEEHKEWLCDYASLSDHLHSIMKPEDKILVIGCGNSPFSHQLWSDGFKNVISIDYAATVIRNMQEKHPNMTWLQMDMRQLEFEAKSFSVVIEKATLDALMDGERDPWNISQEGKANVDRVLKEITRVLTDDGNFISISFAQPHFRLPLYSHGQYGWSASVHTVGEYFHHYIYTMSKGIPINPNHDNRYLCPRASDQCLKPVSFNEDENFLSSISINE